jgi:hypothetical protein
VALGKRPHHYLRGGTLMNLNLDEAFTSIDLENIKNSRLNNTMGIQSAKFRVGNYRTKICNINNLVSSEFKSAV